MLSNINKNLPHDIIVRVLEFYNPYKEFYKNHVLPDIEKVTLGAWYIYDLRDTIRNFIPTEGLMTDRSVFINGRIRGTNTIPSINDFMWYHYKFIQKNIYYGPFIR
jgi:hypothetical protein